jgi:pimeloyl-ACP methyl ester carboxylesterase
MDLPGLLLILLLGLLVSWLWLTAYTAWMLAFPPRRSYAWAVARSLPGDPSELRLNDRPLNHSVAFESWTFRSRGLDLPVWDIRGENARGPVMILTHGWGDSRVTMLGSGRVAALLPWVSRLLVWDLPGHGDAPGHCAMGADERADLAVLIERVATQSGDASIDPSPLVLYGFSLGAFVSLRVADRPEVRAVLAEAPYLSPATPARNTLRLRGLPFRTNLTPALAVLNALHGGRLLRTPAPTSLPSARSSGKTALVIHGTDDAITPLEEGQEVATALQSPFVAIPGGRHVALFADPATRASASTAISEFLSSLH